MRVLVIEDDIATQQTVTLMLQSHGWTVFVADCGQDALELLKATTVDVITLDLNLPDMSGFEVLRELRALGNVAPILILSGLAAIEDKVKGLDLGADDYLTKPFHSDELRARLRALCRRSAGLVCAPPEMVYIVSSEVEQRGLFAHRTLGVGLSAAAVMALENEQRRQDDEPHRIMLDFRKAPDLVAAMEEIAMLGKFIVRDKPWLRLDNNSHNIRRFAKGSGKERQYAKSIHTRRK
jgi:DNA-binding response OmpR family regulator